jgi:hypothetical protein
VAPSRPYAWWTTPSPALHQTLLDQLENTVQGYREYLDRVLR